ncbi:MAG: type I restriction enzyme HsdR N-terminal domain-containing protein [Victivallales bacterium]
MPKFLTVSPTSIAGKKEYAWNNFKKGSYVSIGWLPIDFTNNTIAEIESKLKKEKYDNEVSAISSFQKFMALDIGDYVAVTNVNFGMFGIGRIKSGYKYKLHMHDTGADTEDHFYSHYREVDWLVTDYHKRSELLEEGEKCWSPYGTTGILEPEVPDWVKRATGEMGKPKHEIQYEAPTEYKDLVKNINKLKAAKEHYERAHESLVEEFMVLLGYEKFTDIKYRKGRIDVSISVEGKDLILFEVKHDWNLNYQANPKVISQAYNYALEQGFRFVGITNGDYYAIFDRLKGLSYESNFIGEFLLTKLQSDDIKIVNNIKKSELLKIKVKEILISISEHFKE